MVQKNAEALDWHRADVVAVSTRSRPKAADTTATAHPARLQVSTRSRPKAADASVETLNRQGLHHPVSLRFHQRHMALL